MSTTENLGMIKRQKTLFKKAHELSILCDAEVAVIAFRRDGKLHEFSSTTMEQTLSRYKDQVERTRPEKRRRREAVKPEEPKPCDDHILHELKAQHAELSLEQSRRMGKDLDGLSREELCALEEQQLWALLSVNNKKKELVVEMLQRTRSAEEQRALEEKDLIRGFEGRRERPSVLQDHGLNRMVFGSKPEADSLHNRSSEESDELSDLLQLRL